MRSSCCRSRGPDKSASDRVSTEIARSYTQQNDDVYQSNTESFHNIESLSFGGGDDVEKWSFQVSVPVCLVLAILELWSNLLRICLDVFQARPFRSPEIHGLIKVETVEF